MKQVSKPKYKLLASLFTIALISNIPKGYADENLSVDYNYNGNMIELINPFYWDYEYNAVEIRTDHTLIRMTKEEFENLLNNNEDTIVINDDSTIITYDKNILKEASIKAQENYNKSSEIVKKVILNGGVTIVFLGSTILAINSEKQKKLK